MGKKKKKKTYLTLYPSSLDLMTNQKENKCNPEFATHGSWAGDLV
jgi:hypothetical protein